MDPETRDPRAHHSPSRGLTEPGGPSPGPGKQPPGVSRHSPKHPALDSENHQYTSGQAGGQSHRRRHRRKATTVRQRPGTPPNSAVGFSLLFTLVKIFSI
ncbi:hypothetical protein ATANTOWER_020263 [Ataeniobius toweri]|uniref:Uncharacterized protein n=1 Tax=Ataeniobius toweri TaxID=208326 RepID=A0ABU7CKX8_9TELE|nr:hypothetical protein [Ataeniobius toweri]